MEDIYFFDANNGDMLLHNTSDGLWIYTKGAESQWVSLRKATTDDLDKLDLRVYAIRKYENCEEVKAY